MVPIKKIVTILAKTFTKPLIAFAKQHTKGHFLFLRSGFIWLGNSVHRFEYKINRSFAGRGEKRKGETFIKDLSDDKAFDYGFNFFLEVIVLYGVILGITINETSKSIEEKNNEKEFMAGLKANLAAIGQGIKEEIDKTDNLENKLSELTSTSHATAQNLKLLIKSLESRSSKFSEEEKNFSEKVLDFQQELALIRRKIVGKDNEQVNISGL